MVRSWYQHCRHKASVAKYRPTDGIDSLPHSHKKALAYTFLSCMLWGLVLQFMAGYFFLHSWCNLFSEVLRFADREFYSVSVPTTLIWDPFNINPVLVMTSTVCQDWWTCISFSSFYRKWNLLVHDWIKAYIYQDLKDVSSLVR